MPFPAVSGVTNLEKTFISLTADMQSLRDSFRAALTAGRAPRIEEYLQGHKGELRAELLRQLLRLEIDHLHQRGDTLPVNDYCQRFAEDRPVLNELLDVDDEELNDVWKIVQRLHEFGLIPPAEEQALRNELNSGISGMNADTLCERLVKTQRLTTFQTQRILRGEIDRLVLGDFVLLDRIGQGGMGVVYRARQISLNRVVALKTILSQGSAGEAEIHRFRQEAESAARLHHPGIVPVYAFGEAGGVHFIAMGFVTGSSLAERIAAAALPPLEAAKLVQQLADAIAFAHHEGVIHRDLKPANILLTPEGIPQITDFGLARITGRDGQTLSGDVLGTPSYMPPEQALGKVSLVGEPADIYSLGAVLYACLCGHPPFRAESVMATVRLVIEQPPAAPRQLNQNIPADLETICLRCLEKGHTQRYASAKMLSEELGRFLNGEPILARPVSRPVRLFRWCRRNPVVAALSVTAALLLIVGTLVSTWFAVLAAERAERAEQGNRIAVETLEGVIFQVQEKLRSIPAAREVRKEILLTAMKELEQLSEEELRSDRVDIGKAVVLVRFATLIMDVRSDETLGSLDVAARNLQQACEIYERVSIEDPANKRVVADWAFALLKSGDLAVTMKNYKFARTRIDEAVARYRKMLAAEPENREWARQLSHSLTILGDILQDQGDNSAGLTVYREAGKLSETLRNEKPDDADLLELQITALEKEADATMAAGNHDAARILYEQDLILNQKFLNAAPDDPLRLMSMSICCERIGDLELASGQPEKALGLYQQELEVTLKAIEMDPKNAGYQEELRMPLKKLRNVLQQLGRGEEAVTAELRAEETLQRVRTQHTNQADQTGSKL